MRKPLFFIVLAGLLASSCLKDGLNDFDALKHPISISGTVNPTLGVPIGSGQMTIHDILNMVQESESYVEVSEEGILSIVYDTTASWSIDLDDSKATPRKGAKDSTDVVYTARKPITGNVSFDLFENIKELENAEMEVDSLKLDILTYIKATEKPGCKEMMDSLHVHVYYDSLCIIVTGKDNRHWSTQLPNVVPIDSLLEGQYIRLFNNEDISGAINIQPMRIDYCARMNVAFEAAFFAAAGMNENQFVADVIGIEHVDIDADIKVDFPVSAYINNFSYETDIEFVPSFSLGDLKIDSSMIFLDCENGIPLSLSLRAQLIDSTGTPLCDLLTPATTELTGSVVGLDPVTNLYVTQTPSNTLIQIPITKSVFDNLLNTHGIRLTAGLNTSNTGDPIHKRVTIKDDNYLKVRLWAKIKPSYSLDMDMGESNQGDNSGKGGAQ